MILRSLQLVCMISVTFILDTRAATLPQNATQLTEDLAGIKTGVNCWPASLRGSRLASTRDCLQAALLVPDGADSGVFHQGNPPDIYRLPIAEKYQTCQVIVSMAGTNFDKTSWDHISYSASQMIAICSTGQYPLGQSGGVMYVGSRNLIRISVEKVGVTDLLGDEDTNSTSADLVANA